MPDDQSIIVTSNWVFIISNDRLHLKIDDEWAEDVLAAYNATFMGRKEIQKQWEEYDRRGCPLISYQNPTELAHV